MKNNFVPAGEKIPLARIGVRLMLNKSLDHFTYLGRGPMENYSDRDRGSDVGLYSSSVEEQLTPYPKPMEAGNHEDIRWAALGGAGLPTLLAVSDGKLMQVSALPLMDEQLEAPAHAEDLPPSNSTVLTLDTKTLGVGSNSCGPEALAAIHGLVRVRPSFPTSFGSCLLEITTCPMPPGCLFPES